MSQNLKFGHFCYLCDLVHSLSLFKVIIYLVKLLFPSSLHLNYMISKTGRFMHFFFFTFQKRLWRQHIVFLPKFQVVIEEQICHSGESARYLHKAEHLHFSN